MLLLALMPGLPAAAQKPSYRAGVLAGASFATARGADAENVGCDEFAQFGTFHSTDFSAIVGGGLDIGRAMVGVRHDDGLTKIASTPPPSGGDAGDVDAKNRVFSVYGGFGSRFP